MDAVFGEFEIACYTREVRYKPFITPVIQQRSANSTIKTKIYELT